MFQQDHSEFALRSSQAVYRSEEGALPLWRNVRRAFGFAVSAVAKSIAGIVESARRRHREAVTVRELSALRDRELRDIGIERADIRFIARSMAQNDKDPRRQRQASLHPQANMTLVSGQPPLQPCCS